jgi:hypothetical protein
MARKNFLSTDFFVAVSENEAKRILAILPGQLSQLTLLKQNEIIQSTRFLYHNPERATQFYIDVSLLQLNDQYMRFSLHGSYTNGQYIQSEVEINTMLAAFEKSVFAAVNNEITYEKTETPVRKKSWSLMNHFLSLFISKYHY